MSNAFDWKKLLWWALGLLGAALAVRFLLPPLLPFVFGLGLALAVERPVRTLTGRGLRRGLAAALCVGALLLLAGAGLWLLLRRGVYELQALGRELPSLLRGLAGPMARLRAWLDGLAARAPDGLGATLQAYVDALFASGPAMAGRLSESALGWASGLAAGLPGAVLAVVTALLSGFLISAELPELRRWLRRQLPAAWAQWLAAAGARIKRALGGWLRAQLKLMAITFAIVTLGLLLIGVDYALLLGLLIALVDALPVFGVGTILLPWSVLSFLRGNSRCGFALIGIYGAAALSRTVLEPRLVGRHMGLSPLLALASMYLGYRFLGLAGMIFTPVAAMVVQQFGRAE